MSITSYTNSYHDDYSVTDANGLTPADKGYLRILFKPGYSVQVRELNQLQTTLQDQISRLGSSVWKNDTPIVGGKTSFLPSIFSIEFNLANTTQPQTSAYTAAEIADLAKTIVHIGSGLSAQILGYAKGNGSLYTFYYSYTNSGIEASTEKKEFLETDRVLSLTLNDTASTSISITDATANSNAVGTAAAVVCEAGIFYTKGSFVAVPRQIAFITTDSATEDLSGYALLEIDENIIGHSLDATLLDNANGTPNFTAPGADRYAIDLTLRFIKLADYANQAAEKQYIKLLLVKNSRAEEIVETSEYAEIVDILAKRTSEESGNYTLNPFPIRIRETFSGDSLPVSCIVAGRTYRIQALGTSVGWGPFGVVGTPTVGTEFVAALNAGDGTGATAASGTGGRVSEVAYIHGAYRADDLDQLGYVIKTNNTIDATLQRTAIEQAKENYTLTLDASVAYVDGYRVELASSLNLTAPKALTAQTFPVKVSANIGNYFIGTFATGSALPTISSVSHQYPLKNAANTAIGSCRIKAVDYIGNSGAVISAKLYVYDISFNGLSKFIDIAKIDGNGLLFSVTDDPTSTLKESALNSNIFLLPNSATKTVSSIEYFAQKMFNAQTITNNAVTFLLEGTASSFSDNNDFIVSVTTSSGVTTILPKSAYIVTLQSATSANIVFTPDKTGTATAIARVKIAAVRGGKNKTIPTVETVPNIPTNGTVTLKNSDIIRIVSVTNGVNTITDKFKLIDNGQRDNFYTNGRIQYIGSTALSTTTSIVYEYYSHPSSDDTIYTRNSYSDYDSIPAHSGIELRDALDFRPDILFPVANGVAGTTATANLGKNVVDPGSVIACNAEFYLPRIDAVTVNSSNEFTIVQGNAATNPIEPAVPKNSMTLYMLDVPAYTPDTNLIGKTLVENRRYTMRDIGKIEDRINNIEYYTSLSLLERSASDKSIFDEAGERFKNGILVDNFIGHGVGDVFDSQYQCSVDRGNGILRPRYNSHNVDLVINSTLANGTVDSGKIRVHDSLITLSYASVPLVSHLKATDDISVHPHIYAKTNGSIRLSPAADNWKDTSIRPDLIVKDNGAYDAIAFIAEDPDLDILGTDWENWTREWGIPKIDIVKKKYKKNFWGNHKTNTTVTTATPFIDEREGNFTSLGFSDVMRSFGEGVVSTNIIPFIRSRRVYFHATGLKPSTRVYAFFDGQDISKYTNSIASGASLPAISSAATDTTQLFTGLLDSELGTPEAGYSTYGSQLVSSALGELFGSFVIPNNVSMRFNVGERTFKLTDDSRNAQSETTYADAKYNASGILETVQETILSTKTPEFTVTPLFEEKSGIRTTVEVNGTLVSTATCYKDPIAQSFFIDSNEFTNGVFVTAVDIYFSKKAAVQPVEVYIVTMQNGSLTRTVVPYSKKQLYPGSVAVSGNASAATKFTFTDPVFLKSGEEYAVVVSSNDSNYRCWYATLGSADIATGKRIDRQEYLGTFFTSANAFTWTPQQEQDLKFQIYRADFIKDSTASINFKTKLHSGIDKIEITNAGSGYSNGATITIAAPANGTGAAAKAIINPVDGSISRIVITNRGNNYTAGDLAATNFIAISGSPGSAAAATAKLAAVPVSLYNLLQPNLIFNGTSLKHNINFGTATDVQITAGRDNYIPQSYISGDKNILTATQRATLSSTLATVDSAVSPVIDVDGSSLFTVENTINNDSTTEAVTGVGSAAARYITRKVSLNEPSDRLNIYIATNRPTQVSNIKVYVKLGFDGVKPDSELVWVEYKPTNAIAVNSNPSVYTESEYVVDPNDDFVSFQVKIVMLSDNIVDIPTVRDFRAIATV